MSECTVHKKSVLSRHLLGHVYVCICMCMYVCMLGSTTYVCMLGFRFQCIFHCGLSKSFEDRCIKTSKFIMRIGNKSFTKTIRSFHIPQALNSQRRESMPFMYHDSQKVVLSLCVLRALLPSC